MTATTGQQIKEMRVAMRHTQLSLSVQIGVHSLTISRWERDDTTPHPVFLFAVRQLYQASQGQAA